MMSLVKTLFFTSTDTFPKTLLVRWVGSSKSSWIPWSGIVAHCYYLFLVSKFDDFVFTYVWTLFPFSAKRKGRCLTWRQIVDNLAITPSLTPVSDVNGGTIAISPKFGQPFQVTKNKSRKSQSETERVEWMKIIELFERFFFYNLETFKKCF